MNEEKSYSQLRAMLAITRASLRSIFRSPSAVVFSFLFPIIFIVVFGFVRNGGFILDVGLTPESDTSNFLYQKIIHVPTIRITRDSNDEMTADLNKGRLDGILDIQKPAVSDQPISVVIKTSASSRNTEILMNTLQSVVDRETMKMFSPHQRIAEIREDKLPGRAYNTIDFILPGMLGFSLLSTGVFGTAFVFLNLRNTLVIKRFFATPIRKPYIVLGEALSRVLFALLTSSTLIILGYFVFGFTLIHGILTFVNILILAFIGLFVFMGFGFIISGLAKNESAVPPLANIITLPQFLLAGTFFSTDAFPSWLQPVTKILPLTYLNNAMRKVAFEGATLMDVGKEILILVAWGVVVYFFASRVFKWE
ncbi:MAG TPA: ABC transporter permease [Chitinophagales bacterium]|nr:ABC transporter permease [Chitinophagales bacterium]